LDQEKETENQAGAWAEQERETDTEEVVRPDWEGNLAERQVGSLAGQFSASRHGIGQRAGMAQKMGRDWEQSRDRWSLRRAGGKDREGRRQRRIGCCEARRKRRRNWWIGGR
jgi:hypothetical protein